MMAKLGNKLSDAHEEPIWESNKLGDWLQKNGSHQMTHLVVRRLDYEQELSVLEKYRFYLGVNRPGIS